MPVTHAVPLTTTSPPHISSSTSLSKSALLQPKSYPTVYILQNVIIKFENN